MATTRTRTIQAGDHVNIAIAKTANPRRNNGPLRARVDKVYGDGRLVTRLDVTLEDGSQIFGVRRDDTGKTPDSWHLIN
jgi:hypothetical protein